MEQEHGESQGETKLGVELDITLGKIPLAKIGLGQPQDNTGEDKSSFITGAAICRAISFAPKLFCSVLHTIINCKVSARFRQADGELSVIRIVDPCCWTGVITCEGQGTLGMTGGEIYSTFGHGCVCCGAKGINTCCDEMGTSEIRGELG